jgi:hypothetical protein
MKYLMGILLASLALMLSPVAVQQSRADGGVSLDVFYSSLSPLGEWVVVAEGTYAWRPLNVEADWRPYLHGQWLWSDRGWYWWSDEPWGWATYHYGRWYYDESYGWLWVPGFEWAPAWVEWRYGDECIGWAPLGPYAMFQAGVGIHYSRFWVTPHRYWVFVGGTFFTQPNIAMHVYERNQNDRLLGATRSIGSVRSTGGRTMLPGPDRAFVEQRSGGRIHRAIIEDVESRDASALDRDGDHERIRVYRPQIERNPAEARSARPDRFIQRDGGPVLDPKALDYRPNERPAPPVIRDYHPAQPRNTGRPAVRENPPPVKRDMPPVARPAPGRHEVGRTPAREVPHERKVAPPPAPRRDPPREEGRRDRKD